MTYPLRIAEACYDSLAERVRSACHWQGAGRLDGERTYLALQDELSALAVQLVRSGLAGHGLANHGLANHGLANHGQDAHGRRVSRLLEGVAARQRELHRALEAQRTRRLSRIVDSMTWFAAGSSPAELARAAPAVLCAAGEFDRAMISRVHGSTWAPGTVHVAAGADDKVNARLLAAAGGIRVALTSSLIETGVLRHRAPALVDRAMLGSADRRLGELSRSRGYVVAPVVVADRVIGFLHADTYTSRRALTTTDKANVQAFADMFGLLYERSAMTRRLLDQRQAVAEALSGVMAAPPGAGPAAGQLSRPQQPAVPRPASDGGAWPPPRHHGLTGHEWEILRLLATGATNSQIASALVISESTVKSHIKRILRKLPAANRAEAVYRYTKLIGEAGQAS
jgi:DNA-binding CsgD family transcriptional regulator